MKTMNGGETMTRRRTMVRGARSALIVSVATSMVVAVGARFVHADEVSVGPAPDQQPDCVVSYHAIGNAVAFGAGYEIPFESVAGGPFAQGELTADPRSNAIASQGYEGMVGEIILQTSGVYQQNPTTAQAYYPTPQGGRSADAHDYGLFHTTAFAKPTKSVAEAQSFPVGSQDQRASAFAHSDHLFDGKAVLGSEVAAGHDISLGALHIDFLRSEVNFKTDGTKENSVASWKLEFNGVRNGTTPVYGLNGNGFVFQGGSAMPGDAQRTQFNQQQAQLSKALDDAGLGQADFQIQPGSVTVSGTQIDAKGAGLEIRFAPKQTRGTTTNGASLQFGRVEEHAGVTMGSCDSAPQYPTFEPPAPAAGPNPPKEPPDKCGEDGCKAQPFPPEPPKGPPPLPLPGGKQPVAAPAGIAPLAPTGLMPGAVAALQGLVAAPPNVK
jgi:hypothetical protein